MKKILFALLISLPAFGADSRVEQSTFDFTFFGTGGGRYTMVDCDYAEYTATKWMEKFGAKDLDTQCSGGIQPFGSLTPLSLRVRYTPTNLTGQTTTQTFKIESGAFSGDTNCDFDTELMRAMKDEFKNVSFTRRSDFCFSAESSYTFEGTITLGEPASSVVSPAAPTDFPVDPPIKGDAPIHDWSH